ncbi:TetR/AcrR family transcriptional regulator [Actinomadura scrupuli]|uniref:TetR/AcrR family transcriptional regulator n=1 Tax=Actinomadura scrupuli TaxID=559629 RepID=UPI003D9777B5
MAESGATPRRRLAPQDWATAALDAIAEGGLAAVAVEPLAIRLGTTKGSFYWHFANREALLEAALARWEELHTIEVNAEVEAAVADPARRLRLLIERVTALADGDRAGVVLHAAADHPAVARVLARVARRRVDFLAGLFSQLGLPAVRARQRALLAYSAYLGHAQLAQSLPGLMPEGKRARQEYLDHIVGVLTAP